eukprot:ANDGO_06106.mRNA.1 hypothetical protein
MSFAGDGEDDDDFGDFVSAPVQPVAIAQNPSSSSHAAAIRSGTVPPAAPVPSHAAVAEPHMPPQSAAPKPSTTSIVASVSSVLAKKQSNASDVDKLLDSAFVGFATALKNDWAKKPLLGTQNGAAASEQSSVSATATAAAEFSESEASRKTSGNVRSKSILKVPGSAREKPRRKLQFSNDVQVQLYYKDTVRSVDDFSTMEDDFQFGDDDFGAAGFMGKSVTTLSPSHTNSKGASIVLPTTPLVFKRKNKVLVQVHDIPSPPHSPTSSPPDRKNTSSSLPLSSAPLQPAETSSQVPLTPYYAPPVPPPMPPPVPIFDAPPVPIMFNSSPYGLSTAIPATNAEPVSIAVRTGATSELVEQTEDDWGDFQSSSLIDPALEKQQETLTFQASNAASLSHSTSFSLNQPLAPVPQPSEANDSGFLSGTDSTLSASGLEDNGWSSFESGPSSDVSTFSMQEKEPDLSWAPTSFSSTAATPSAVSFSWDVVPASAMSALLHPPLPSSSSSSLPPPPLLLLLCRLAFSRFLRQLKSQSALLFIRMTRLLGQRRLARCRHLVSPPVTTTLQWFPRTARTARTASTMSVFPIPQDRRFFLNAPRRQCLYPLKLLHLHLHQYLYLWSTAHLREIQLRTISVARLDLHNCRRRKSPQIRMHNIHVHRRTAPPRLSGARPTLQLSRH